MTGKTRVFVSSTCKDLELERTVLKDRIKLIGHDVLLSEFSEHFPIGENVDPIEHCRRNVRENTDFFLLVIGKRYGFVEPATKKSATHIEFETAKHNHLEMLIVVKREVWNTLSLWEKDPTGDYSQYVESNQVYEFLKEIQENNYFATTFDTIEELVQIATDQLSVHYKTLLDRKKEGKLKPIPELLNEPEYIQQIAINKPDYWRVKLFEELLRYRLTRIKNDYDDLSNGRFYQPTVYLSTEKFIPWAWSKIADIQRLITVLIQRLNKYVNPITQNIDTPDPIQLLISVNRISEICEACVVWQKDFHFVVTVPAFSDLIDAAKELLPTTFNNLTALPDEIQKTYSIESKETVYLKILVNAPIFPFMTKFLKACEHPEVIPYFKDFYPVMQSSGVIEAMEKLMLEYAKE